MADPFLHIVVIDTLGACLIDAGRAVAGLRGAAALLLFGQKQSFVALLALERVGACFAIVNASIAP